MVDHVSIDMTAEELNDLIQASFIIEADKVAKEEYKQRMRKMRRRLTEAWKRLDAKQKVSAT